jgi:hypothetical protein
LIRAADYAGKRPFGKPFSRSKKINNPKKAAKKNCLASAKAAAWYVLPTFFICAPVPFFLFGGYVLNPCEQLLHGRRKC